MTASAPKHSKERDSRIWAILQRESRKLAFRLTVALAGLLIVVIVVVLRQPAGGPPATKQAVVALAGHPFRVDVADTPALREHGLSGRASLGDNQGMLFSYDKPAQDCYWMKDMKFNLDILWFDADKKLIYQKNNVSPQSYPQNFCPDKPAAYVVEIKPGIVRLEIGDPLVLQNQ